MPDLPPVRRALAGEETSLARLIVVVLMVMVFIAFPFLC